MRLLLFFALILGLLSPNPSWSEELPIATGEWAPFVSKDIPGLGFSAEIITEALAAANLKPHYIFAPWRRSEVETAQGKHFATFPYFPSGERTPFFLYSDPIVPSNMVFFYRKDRMPNFDFEKLEDLQHLTVGGVLGYFYHELFENAGLNVVYSSKTDQAFRQLDQGWVDVVAEGRLAGQYTLKKIFPTKHHLFADTKTAIRKDHLVLMASRRWPGAPTLVQRFNKGLKTIKENGRYQIILNKYGIRP